MFVIVVGAAAFFFRKSNFTSPNEIFFEPVVSIYFILIPTALKYIL